MARAAAPLLALALALVGCTRPAAGPPGLPQVTGSPGRGEELFGRIGCIGCHTIKGVGGQVGPNLTEVAQRELRRERPGGSWPDVVTYIKESIRTPRVYVVPGFPNPSPGRSRCRPRRRRSETA